MQQREGKGSLYTAQRLRITHTAKEGNVDESNAEKSNKQRLKTELKHQRKLTVKVKQETTLITQKRQLIVNTLQRNSGEARTIIIIINPQQ